MDELETLISRAFDRTRAFRACLLTLQSEAKAVKDGEIKPSAFDAESAQALRRNAARLYNLASTIDNEVSDMTAPKE